MGVEEVGKRNKATIEKQYKIQNELNAKSIGAADVKKLFGEFAEIYATKMDCDVIPTAPGGVRLKGVPVGECFGEVLKVLAGCVFHEQKAVDVTIGPEGKIIIVYEVDDVTKDGKRFSIPMFVRYEFNDDGKIVGYLAIFNPGLLHPFVEQDLISSPWTST